MDPFKKLEARLVHLQLLVLSLKFPVDQNPTKGKLVDTDFALISTGMDVKEFKKAVIKHGIPLYFFEEDLKQIHSQNKEEVAHG